MANVTVVGEAILDRFVSADGRITDVAGGSAANTSFALQLAGNQTHFRARFSSDSDGVFLRSTSLARGLDLSGSVVVDDPATTVRITTTDAGTPTYEFFLNGSADWQWTQSEIVRELPTDTDAVILGSLASVLEPGCNVLFDWARLLKQQGMPICYDPNARPSVFSNEEASRVRDLITDWVGISDVVKVSDEDLAWISPGRNPLHVACQWSTLGPKLVVLTGGHQGTWAYQSGVEIHRELAPQIEVADTVGAGDTLMAWLVGGLMDMNPDHRFEVEHIRKVLGVATRAAAITCTRVGCQPPTQSGVRNLQD